jgi:hypothetical protein
LVEIYEEEVQAEELDNDYESQITLLIMQD